MDWGIISIPLAIIFFIVSIVLTLKVAKRKKPVWAYKTTKIIGLGTNAPPELKLTFNGKPVADVYDTTFIFFNMGTESIRKEDVTDNATIHFKGAEILRQPTIKAKSKEAIRFSAKQVVKDGDNAIELGFLYLDHQDGAIVEVIHTESREIACKANIIGAKKIVNIGEFKQSRRRFLGVRIVLSLLAVIAFIGMLVIYFLTDLAAGFKAYSKEGPIIAALISAIFGVVNGYAMGMVGVDLPQYLHSRKFPAWSIVER